MEGKEKGEWVLLSWGTSCLTKEVESQRMVLQSWPAATGPTVRICETNLIEIRDCSCQTR